MNHKKQRGGKAQGLVETAAAMAVLIPLFMLILYVSSEISQAYMIKTAMTAAAHRAARNLSIAYWQNSTISNNRAAQESLVLDQIRIGTMVVDSHQFSDVTYELNATPPSVSVTVTYTGGQYGLAPFPNPDPLHLGSQFQISSTETHALE
jgi:Flp pilus assembly protein TadG